ncbi:hypothetical protein GPA10_22245 [Streptomyces sp. p1417]|uniref:Uncharacterized protein n=1 Tax=Streptomyces typhae TaxID=2681492 RepID=A0A6L6X182_9ACTN|nr:hypothetical protein [Streptomyces typhae]MVO87409.1 hypothetical protein [Streptomyces typhae]
MQAIAKDLICGELSYDGTRLVEISGAVALGSGEIESDSDRETTRQVLAYQEV